MGVEESTGTSELLAEASSYRIRSFVDCCPLLLFSMQVCRVSFIPSASGDAFHPGLSRVDLAGNRHDGSLLLTHQLPFQLTGLKAFCSGAQILHPFHWHLLLAVMTEIISLKKSPYGVSIQEQILKAGVFFCTAHFLHKPPDGSATNTSSGPRVSPSCLCLAEKVVNKSP